MADRGRASGELRPLSGVPLGIKGLFCTAGVQTTAASHILEGFTPTYESTVTAKLFAAGAGLLLTEAVLANRLSKRFGFGLS